MFSLHGIDSLFEQIAQGRQFGFQPFVDVDRHFALLAVLGQFTGSQAGLKAKERRSNVRRAFDIHPRWLAALDGKAVLLVDDVLTTGATVDACVRTLEQGGARHVDVLTLARVVRPAL